MPYIASGSYGCVFMPHLKCKNKLKVKDSVGKVFFTKEDYESEKDINKTIVKIDPKGKFTVPLVGSCDTDSNNIQATDEVDKCTYVDLNQHEYGQLIYKYGGKSLMDVLLERKGSGAAFKKIFKSLFNVIEGIHAVSSAGYVHQDIKPDNILLGKTLSDQAYLIDFGIIDKKDNIYTDDNISMLKYDYPYFPPEYKMYVYNTNFDTFWKLFSDNFYYAFKFNGRKRYLLQEFKNIGIDMSTLCREAYAEPKYDVDKIDVYSFGIVLCMTWIWSMQKVKKSLVEDINTYILGLIHPVTSKRYSTEKAVAEHQRIMNLF